MSKKIINKTTFSDALFAISTNKTIANQIYLEKELKYPIIKKNKKGEKFFNTDKIATPLINLNQEVYLVAEGFLLTDIIPGDILHTRNGSIFSVHPPLEGKDYVELKTVSCTKSFIPFILCWDVFLDYGINKEWNISKVERNGEVIYIGEDN